MTQPPATHVHIGAARVRWLRTAATAAFLVMTIAAVALFFVTLELSLRLPDSNPYSDVYLLVATAGPLAVLLHGLGVLLIWRHTEDGEALELTGCRRILTGGIACVLLATAAVVLTPLVTPPPFGGYAWITLPSLALTLLLTTSTAAALRAPVWRSDRKSSPKIN